MKRGLIVLFLLLIIPLASAEIVLNDNFGTHNLGDTVSVEGYILLNEKVNSDIFRADLLCGNSVFTLPIFKSIEVKKDIKYFFNEDARLLTGGYKGECSIRVSFHGESQTSENFEISDELKGDVFLNKEKFQLGDILNINGDVLYLDNDKFDPGIGIITLSKDDEDYFGDVIEIFSGNVEYNTLLKDLPSGIYSVNLEVNDFYGNKKMFDLGSIELTNKLSADTTTNKDDYLPEEKIEVKGKINDGTGGYKVTIEFGNQTYEETYEKMEFDYFINLEKNIKSGNHDLTIRINDEFGNYYENELNINIIGVPTTLKASVDKESYMPEDKVEIFSTVYDQGEELYSDSINLRILDPKNREISNVDVSSGSVYGLELEKYAIPGDYRIEVKSTDFKKDILFKVNELEKIDAYYEDNQLKISNEGNVNIDNQITIYLDDKSFNFNLKSSPSEIEGYDLKGKLKEGNYNLKVKLNYQEIDVGEVYIEKGGLSAMLTGALTYEGGVRSWVYLIISVIVIAVILYFVFRSSGKKEEYYRKKDFREGQEKLRRMRDERLKVKPKRLFNAKDVNEDDAKQFRNDMVRKMKER